MQITRELIEADIKGMEVQLENLKMQAAQTLGALNTLKGVRDYMDKPEEPEVETPKMEVKAEDVTATLAEPETRQVVDGNGKYNDVAVEEPHLG